jgi:hypothetical protein
MEYHAYKLQRMLRNANLARMSGYYKDFYFDAHPDVFEALKDNEETDRLVEDMLAGSTIL